MKTFIGKLRLFDQNVTGERNVKNFLKNSMERIKKKKFPRNSFHGLFLDAELCKPFVRTFFAREEMKILSDHILILQCF